MKTSDRLNEVCSCGKRMGEHPVQPPWWPCMLKQPEKLKWYPASRRPTEPGVYLIWSRRLGARICDTHPSWWNMRDHLRRGKDFNGPRVTRWAYLWPFGHFSKPENQR